MWDIAIGVLWGVGSVWKGHIVCLNLSFQRGHLSQQLMNQVPESEQINLLIQIATSTSNPRLKVKCIGTLECLAHNPTAVEANLVNPNANLVSHIY